MIEKGKKELSQNLWVLKLILLIKIIICSISYTAYDMNHMIRIYML